MIKAIIDFSGYTGPDLVPVSKTNHDKMTANAATFTTPPVTMAALQTLIDTFEDKLSKKSSHAIADTIAFNIARNDLEVALGELGNYVNIEAKGDPAIVEKSGFPSFDTTRVVDTAPPAAPQDVRLRQGDLSGEIVARYKPGRQRSMNEVQTTVGDPNSAVGWTHAGMFSGGKATTAMHRAVPCGCASAQPGSKASWVPGATRPKSWSCNRSHDVGQNRFSLSTANWARPAALGDNGRLGDYIEPFPANHAGDASRIFLN